MLFGRELLQVLACPQDRGELLFVESEECFYNPRLRLRYPIRDGVPVLLVEEAQTVGEQEHRRLVGEHG